VKDDSLVLLLTPDRVPSSAGGDGHLDRRAGQLSIGMDAGGGTEQPTAIEVDHGRQIQLRTTAVRAGGDLGHVTDPPEVRTVRGEVPLEEVGELRDGLVLLGEPVSAPDPPRNQALAPHRLRDRLLRDPPAVIAQVVDQTRGSVQTLGLAERKPHDPVDRVTTLVSGPFCV
jgi:hypothetical protein